MSIMLRRQGVSQTVNGMISEHQHIEIAYHHGGQYFFATLTHYNPTEDQDRLGSVQSHQTYKIPKAETTAEAIRATAEKFKLDLSEEIEAYCYSNAKSLEIWPHIANDVYITTAVYEPYSDTIRHCPSNYCLISFSDEAGQPLPHVIPGEEGAKQYPREACNRKYTKEILKAVANYNANPRANGTGIERKAWLAWLVGQYIGKMDGEKPIKTQSIIKRSVANV